MVNEQIKLPLVHMEGHAPVQKGWIAIEPKTITIAISLYPHSSTGSNTLHSKAFGMPLPEQSVVF